MWVYFAERGLSEKQAYPRAVGDPSQKTVSTREEYLGFLKECWSKGPCFTSKYSLPQLEEGYVEFFVVDADLRVLTPEKVAEFKDMVQTFFPKSTVFFTGKKGFHVHVLTEPIRKEVFFAGLEILMADVVSDYGFVDVNVTLVPSYLVRIPFTRHDPGSGNYMVLADMDMSPSSLISDVLSKSRKAVAEPFQYSVDTYLSSEIRRLGEASLPKGRYTELFFSLAPEVYGEPPCILFLLEKLRKTGEMDHWARVLLTSYMFWSGKTEEEVVEIFRKYASDFDEEKTRYQVKHIFSHKYYPHACRNIIANGACPMRNPRKCPYYPWMYLKLTSKTETKQ